jgi:hypothetical protein
MTLKYQYDSLDKSGSQFRLVNLLPSSDTTARINVHIYTTLLPSDTVYEALSYAWGDPSTGHLIYEEQNSIEVGENLYQALTHLRHADKSRTLWIDALCINQTDNSEKNHQVRHMRDIYSGAEEVIVWLGITDTDIDAAVAYIKEYYEFRNLQNQPMAGFKKLYRYPWWTRMWVVQEVCVAKEYPIFRVGHHELDWYDTVDDVLSQICQQDLNRDMSSRVLEDPFSLKEFADLREMCETPNKDLLGRLLYTTANRRATLPHDHVYALLGILGDQLSELEIDYSLPEQTVFKDTMAILLQQQDLNWLFHAVKDYPSKQGQENLPSWCIDFSDQGWAQNANNQGWYIFDDDKNRKAQKVHGASTGRNMAPIIYHKDDGTITVSGTRVGSIKYSHTATTKPLRISEDPAPKANLRGKSLSSYLDNIIHTTGQRPNDFELHKEVEANLNRLFGDIIQFIEHSEQAWARRLDTNGSIIDFEGCISKLLFTERSNYRIMKIFDMLPMISETADFSILQKCAGKLGMIKSAIKHDWTEIIRSAQVLEQYVLYSFLAMAEDTVGRCYFTTETGYSGIAGHAVEDGDVLCILFGCKLPVVLRPQSDGAFTLVTFTNTLDIMEGQFLTDASSVIECTFTLR